MLLRDGDQCKFPLGFTHFIGVAIGLGFGVGQCE